MCGTVFPKDDSEGGVSWRVTGRRAALGGVEEEVGVALGMKRRVEADEVHGFGGEDVA